MFNPTTHSLVLRACNEDMSSTKGFIWPTSGLVECSDWNPVSKCGNGLHGWLYGHGDGSVSEYWSVSDRWLVVAVETKSIVELEGKVKFPKGEVVFCGDRKSATEFLLEYEPRSKDQPVIGAFITVNDKLTATTSYKGTSTSGHYGTSTSGDSGTSTSGHYGTSTSGFGGTSTSGHHGTSTSGFGGTSTSGDSGTSTSGHHGKCKAGVKGIIQIRYYDNDGYKIKTGYIGEDGLEPDVFYKLDENFNFVKCE